MESYNNINMSSCYLTFPGHNAYEGFLVVDHAYNNPVVHVFVRLMVDVVADNRTSLSSRPDVLYNSEIAHDVEGE